MTNRYCEDCNNRAVCTKKQTQVATFCTMYVPAIKPESKTSASRKNFTGLEKFETGATRSVEGGKLNYVRALSPIVLERYVQYLNAHRKQSDGSMRDFDNWKKGIPIDRYLEGLGRHFIAAWLLEQGFPAEDDRGPVTLEDTLCAIIFGASGWLHEIIKDKRNEKCGI